MNALLLAIALQAQYQLDSDEEYPRQTWVMLEADGWVFDAMSGHCLETREILRYEAI